MPSAPEAFNQNDLDMLIVYSLRVESVMLEVFHKMKFEDFTGAYEKPHTLLFVIAKDFYTEHKQRIPFSLLADQAEARMAGQPDFMHPSSRQAVYDLIVKIAEYKEADFVPSYGMQLLSMFLYNRRVGQKLAMMRDKQNQGFMPTKEEIDGLKAEADHSTVAAIEIHSPFLNPEDADYEMAPMEPTGVDFIDVMLGGGVQAGRLYGFIGPSGGGKTTLSNQLAVAYAMSGRQMLVLSYEEGVDAEYLCPIRANAARIPRDIIAKMRSINDLSPEHQVQYKRACDKIGRFLHFADMSGTNNAGFGGAEEIEQLVIRYQSNGVKVGGIILDWFWLWVQRVYAVTTFPRGQEQDLRTFSQKLMDKVRAIARKYKLWIWVNQQTAPSEVGKGSASWTDSAECKSFAWLVSFCFALNEMDADQIAELNLAKGRAARKVKQHIQLDGMHARFVSLSEDMEFDPRTKRHVRVGDEGKVPKEDKAPASKSSVRDDFEGGRGGK